MPYIVPTYILTYQREPYPDEPFFWHQMTVESSSWHLDTADKLARKTLDQKLLDSQPRVPVLYQPGIWHLKEAKCCDNRKNPRTTLIDISPNNNYL